MRHALGHFLLLASITAMAPGRGTASAADPSLPPPAGASATDPHALMRVIEDARATGPARLDALRQLGTLGPAAKPVIPALCKLLTRTDSLPGTSMHEEAAGVLRRIGPAGAKAAVAAARADLAALRPGELPFAGWRSVLSEMSPAATLVDALADRNQPWAETAAHALAVQVKTRGHTPAVRAALKGAGPKLVAGWKRAATAARPPEPEPRPGVPADALIPPRTWEDRRREWLGSIVAVAEAAGPKTVDAVAAAAQAHAKAHRPDTAAVAAAVKNLARAARTPPPASGIPDSKVLAAQQAVVAFGPAAVVPLMEVAAADARARPMALAVLQQVIGTVPRAVMTDATTVRRRLMLGEPAPALPLDPRGKAAAARAVPALLKLADEAGADVQEHPAAPLAWWLLGTIAPDVPAAAAALLARLDKTSEGFVPFVAAALSQCDPAVRKQLDAAATSGSDRVKDIAFRARLRYLPPAAAAAEIIAKVPPDERQLFIGRMNEQSGGEIVPLLIELLPDQPSSTSHSVKTRAAENVPAVLAALDRPEPAIRAGVLNALPRDALTPDVLTKVAARLGDAEEATGEAAVQVLQAADAAALPALLGAAKSPAPAARARVAEALVAFSSEAGRTFYSAANEAKAVAALGTLLGDADAAVRAAAVRAASYMPTAATPLLARHLGRATVVQRQHLAQAVIDAGSPSHPAPLSDELVDLAAKISREGPAAAATGAASGAPEIPVAHRPALLVARLSQHGDGAVAAAAEDVLLRMDVVALYRNPPPEPEPTAEQAAALVAATTGPNAATRIKAIEVIRANGEQPFKGAGDAILAALSDRRRFVRMAAIDASHVLAARVGDRLDMAFTKLIDLADHDPSPAVRERAARALDTVVRPGHPSRVRLMARSEVEAERVVAAAALGFARDPRAEPSADNPRPDRYLADLTRLLDDPAAPVRRAAAIAVARHVSPRQPGGPAAETIVKRLANPAALDPDAKAALLGVVPWMAAAGVKGLADHGNPDVKTAALLGIEQPHEAPVAPAKRVPVPMAASGLGSPSPQVRQMAARSLLTPDPADPARLGAGAQALLTAANDPRPRVAVNALDALVAGYCGPRIGDGFPKYKQFKEAGIEVARAPTAYEVAVAQLLRRCGSGPVPARLAAIGEVGAGEPALLAARWDAFIYLLEDADPQIRAAAFQVARAQAQKAVPAAVAAGRQPTILLKPLPLR